MEFNLYMNINSIGSMDVMDAITDSLVRNRVLSGTSLLFKIVRTASY